ncbi:hypothetical protein FG05_35239 [Fusarium graminearum]|nr:hypothetical protein FG05_35239 [Fusarium graminearum]
MSQYIWIYPTYAPAL